MPLYDSEIMIRLVSELKKSLARLNAIAELPFDEYRKDPDKIGSSKYHFIVAIEACIDMGNHVIARNGYRVPEDYADTFRVMNEAGIFDDSFTQELTRMARFRNRLVHLYWEVDEKQLYDLLKTKREDFTLYLKGISAFLEWKADR